MVLELIGVGIMKEECRQLLISQFEAIQWLGAVFGSSILVIFLILFWIIQQLENIDRRLYREEMFRDGIKQV